MSFFTRQGRALLLIVAVVVGAMCSSSGDSTLRSLLVRQWITKESNVDRDLISEKMEFFGDGTGVMESSNIRGVGAWAESFTWKIGSDGRLIVVLPSGVTQVYEIAEISKSKLILSGNILNIGNIRTTFLSQSAIKDANNKKKYKTTKIGGRTWMAENLNIAGGTSWCYENREDNCDKYGRLYDWATAKTICPKGWYLPDSMDWIRLEKAVGYDNPGKKLKSTSGWKNKSDGSDGNGTDDYGFSALPGGIRTSQDNSFAEVGNAGIWWILTERDEYSAYARFISNIANPRTGSPEEMLYWSYGEDKINGFSVRCLQNNKSEEVAIRKAEKVAAKEDTEEFAGDKAYNMAKKSSGDVRRTQLKTAYINYRKAVQGNPPNKISKKLRNRFIEMCIVRAKMVLNEGNATMDAIPLLIADIEGQLKDNVSANLRQEYAAFLAQLGDSSASKENFGDALKYYDMAIERATDAKPFLNKHNIIKGRVKENGVSGIMVETH